MGQKVNSWFYRKSGVTVHRTLGTSFKISGGD